MPVSLYLTNLISVLTLVLHCSIKQVQVHYIKGGRVGRGGGENDASLLHCVSWGNLTHDLWAVEEV